MKTAVMTAIRKIEFQDRPMPKVQPHEVLVEIEYVGVCGSDLHYYEDGRIGDYIVDGPIVLGHEVAGVVTELGSAVKNLEIGDRVAIGPQITCGTCEFCKSGKYNLCREVEFFATPPVDGVFQEYVAHPAELCFKLPDNVSSLEGALIEPLSVGMHAVDQSSAKLGQTAVVTGSGCIGLTALLSLKASGVSKVYLTDLYEKRLAKAKALGADEVIHGRDEDLIQRLDGLTDGKGFDLAIDTTGSSAVIGQLVRAAKPGATIVFVGYSPDGSLTIPLGEVLDKEITFKSVFRYRNSYPAAIAALESGQIDVKSIASHIYDFDELPRAMEEAIDNKDEILKAVIKVKL